MSIERVWAEHDRIQQQLRPQPCGMRVAAGHGYLLPCPNLRPCPIHRAKREAVSPDERAEASGL